SSWVSLAKEVLSGSDVKICAVVGFPLGAMSTEAKIFEAARAILAGADEIDMVINIGYLLSGMSEAVKEEIAAIKKTIGNKILKVIIETCYLTDDEKKLACELAVLARADFVKTSTGFGTGGASLEDTALMLETVKDKAYVKASGGVRDREAAEAYIKQGVMRLGTSNGIAIIEAE
ncbi:MAG TPA: deoxyribose-phosphate aldolase, partial [Treponemataceae bacterium]|nr:deoxyribose-phosphate aldolase [Treponemataceae bacterium]